MWTSLILIVLAALAAWSAQPAAQPSTRTDIPLRWEGTATVKAAFSPAAAFGAADWDGSFSDSRQIRFRAREERRTDVTGADGRVVGHVAWLADDGSTWEGSVADTETHLGTIRLIAAAAGRGQAQVFGLVYRSLGEGDPLGDVLPDGTYCLQTLMAPAIPYTLVIREPNRRDERSEEQSTSMFLAGDCSLPRKIAMAGSPLTVEKLRAAVNAPLRPGEEFSVESRRALVNGVMTGSYDRGIPASQGTRVTAQWNIRRRLAINGILGEVDAAWRPKIDENMTPVTVKASIDPALGLEGRFRFTLYDVSQEPGFALNSGTGTGFDLRFSSDQPTAFSAAERTGDGFRIETAGSLSEASVNVVAYDFGAWGRLKAEINIDGEWYECLTTAGSAYVTVPVDANENRIWDTWERNVKMWGRPATEDVDDEEDATTRFKGDGFSIYEEYRGFMVNGHWVGLDPRYRELFVFDEAGRGLGLVYGSGIQVFSIKQWDFKRDTRELNFNRGYATRGLQRALHIKDKRLRAGVLGQVEPTVGTPNTVTGVYLDTLKLDAETDSDAIGSVVAHELGHAMNVEHHGEYQEARCNGGDKGLVSLWRGAFSGERACVMGYSAADYYRAWDGRCYDFDFPEEWGTTFCLTKAGSGFNAGERRMESGHPMPVAGDAAHGDCKHAIRLR